MEESPHCPFDVVEACRTGDLDTGSGDRGTRFRLPPGRGPTDNDWKTMTKGQKRNWKQRGGSGRSGDA